MAANGNGDVAPRMAILDYEGYVDEDEEDNLEEKDSAIDQTWENQQKKSFAAWCNAHLRKVNEQIVKIEEDFRTGLRLMQLLEVISGDKLPKPDRGKMRFHKIANVNKALEFIQGKGVRLVLIGAEEIVDGNVKMTLGMIWTIILRFSIQEIHVDDLSAKEGLLLWCRRSTAGYKNVAINNFHTNFKDGLGFCALINRYRPDLLDFQKLSKDNPVENLNLAFEVAERQLDIPRMLDAEDMVNSVKPDERSVMAYVSCYYHVFSGAQKANVATTRICKLLEVTQLNEMLRKEYETLSSDLLKWIEAKQNQFQCTGSVDNSVDVESRLQDFRVFRQEEKPPKLAEKARVEITFSKLQTRLRLSNRPPYMPVAGRLVSDIGKRWKSLEESEKKYEDWLLCELQRLKTLEHLVRKFNIKCTTHETWENGKAKALASKDYQSANLGELRALTKKHDAFQSEITAYDARVKRIQALADELESHGYVDIATINGRRNVIASNWSMMTELSETRKQSLGVTLSVMERIDSLHLEIAKAAGPFKIWLEQADEDLQDDVLAHSTAEVERGITLHNEFKESMSKMEELKHHIGQLESEVEKLAVDHHLQTAHENLYISVTYQGLMAQWEEVVALTENRTAKLHAALERQKANDMLRQNFAQRASEMNTWLENHSACLTPDALTTGVGLDAQLKLLEDLEKEAVDKRADINELEKCQQALHEAYVFEVSYTPFTMETLRSGWDQLSASIQFTKNELENQILTRDSKGLKPEQIDDFRKSFNHFDRDKTGTLEPNEFRACLVSLGYSLPEDAKTKSGSKSRTLSQNDAEYFKIWNSVDPNKTGCVTFDVFMDFMSRELSDLDTSEQILQSFETLAGDKGYVTVEDIRRELPPDQADFCLSRMHPKPEGSGDSGALDFGLFVSEIYGM